MKLEEAIHHIDDLIEQNDFPCEQCADEHKQLREWLIRLEYLERCYENHEKYRKSLELAVLSMFDIINDFCAPAYAEECKRMVEEIGLDAYVR